MNITDPIRQFAHASPDAEAIVRPDGRIVSYRELDRTIDYVAAGVRKLGLGPGSIVRVGVRGWYPDLCCRLALARLGICIAAQSMPTSAVAFCLTDRAMPDDPGNKFELFDRLWPTDAALITDVPAVPSHQDGATICAFYPTSGTTGFPKFVAISHDLMAQRIALIPSALRLPVDARLICTAGAGTGYGFQRRIMVLRSGGSLVAAAGADRMLARIDRYRVSHLAMAPFTLNRLAKALPDGSTPLPSLRQIEVSGSALPTQLRDLARERLCANIVSQYGSTEAGPIATGTILSMQSQPGAVGYLYTGVEVEAVDADDTALPLGTEGLLRVRSTGCAVAYFGDPVASAHVFRDGWVYTGDLGIVARDGLLTVTGRASEVINQGGMKISPQVIEDVLSFVDEIAEAAAFGVPDALGVTRIWAAIVPSGPVDLAAVKTLCRERLQHNAPTAFLQLKALPRNEAGKVLHDDLRKMALAGMRKRSGAPAVDPVNDDVRKYD